jgi:hypothetical protein
MEKARHARAEEGRLRRTGIRFRSQWEANLALALDRRGLAWAYEPKTFDTPHGLYTPDFQVGEVFIDIKGHRNAEQERRINHLVAEGIHLSIVRGRRGGEPDYREVAEAIRDGQLPAGTVFT